MGTANTCMYKILGISKKKKKKKMPVMLNAQGTKTNLI